MTPTPAMIVVNFDQIDAVIQRRAYWSGTHDSAPTSDEPRFIWHILRRGEKNGQAMPSEYGDDGDGASDIQDAVKWIEFTFYGGGAASSNNTVSGPFTATEMLKRDELQREVKKSPLPSGWDKFGADWQKFYTWDFDTNTYQWKDDDDAK